MDEYQEDDIRVLTLTGCARAKKASVTEVAAVV
jgi:hypothetical protein